MSNKRNTIIFLSAVLIVLFGASSLIVYGLNLEKESDQTMASPAEYVETSIPKSQAIIREDAPETVTISVEEPKNPEKYGESDASLSSDSKKTTQKELTYAATNNTMPDNPIDVYQDENKAEYRFNSNGVLTSYMASNVAQKASDAVTEYARAGIAPLTDEQCIEVAKNHLIATYGKERYEQFELEVIDYYTRNTGAGYDQITIVFSKRYGREAFFDGLTASVTIIKTDGAIYYSSMRDNSVYKDIDENYLNSISKETVDAWFAQEVEKLSPGASVDSIFGYTLKRIDGKFFIEACVFYTGVGQYPIDTILYYPLDV